MCPAPFALLCAVKPMSMGILAFLVPTHHDRALRFQSAVDLQM